ncbi:PIN domain-containing protein [Sphingobium nicotianae]|uniref:PIN domain-containing protein n=1 Tax=Sphingobium nicotianae TaxID=2782607 RepID=A0A9X1ITF5_9SPHN|nr:PIN domain-containing protein [Sphingobium nicotianae]MBT2189179.1 hypothetical protein [Sphingobium nicotianae]
MPILVSDTSVIIDLERGSFLQDLFSLPFEFAVPDLLFDRELKGELGEQLLALGLRVEELDSSELARAIVVRRERTALSTPDTFAFAIAESRNWALLTGDGALRRFASDQGVATNGVLWICDQLEAHAVLDCERLHAGLTTISGHPRCRLPGAEVTARLKRYSAGG